MQMRTLFAAAAAAFVVAPTIVSMAANAATETPQASVQKCHYYYHAGHRWRYYWHGGYYNYRWRGRYYRFRHHCHYVGGWCYR